MSSWSSRNAFPAKALKQKRLEQIAFAAFRQYIKTLRWPVHFSGRRKRMSDGKMKHLINWPRFGLITATPLDWLVVLRGPALRRPMTTPRISVLIDTHNQERYIEQAIVSVLEQDFPAEEVEILVVDDGSTDRTPEIVGKFVPRVRYLRKENGGQASAFNACIPELHGRIVSFLDGDDWWARKKLAAVAEAFERNPEIAAVGHGYYEVRDDEPPREMFVPEKTCRLDLTSVEAARFANAGLTLLGTSRLSVRREVLNRIGPVPLEVVFFDAPVFSFALALGGAVILDEPLCYYRQHSQNLYAPITVDEATLHRRIDRLGFLLSYVPPRLAEFGVARECDRCVCRISATRIRTGQAPVRRRGTAGGISHRAPQVSRTL